MQEERRRRRNNSSGRRRLRRLVLALLVLVPLAVTLYLTNLDKVFAYRFERASDLLVRGDYQEAVIALQELQQDYPEQAGAPRALYLAAETLDLQLQQHQQALLAYLVLARDYPESPESLDAELRAADLYKNQQHDFGQALSLLQKVADSSPPHPDQVQYEIADCYFRLNNFEQARIEFDSLLHNFPDSILAPESEYRIGMTYAFEKDYPQAATLLEQMAKRWPGNRYAIEARFSLAGVLEEQELLRRALSVLKGLEGEYPHPDILQQRIDQVEQRIRKKQKAI